MKFKEDIQQQISLDFNDSADKVVEILTDAISKTDYLKTDRIFGVLSF